MILIRELRIVMIFIIAIFAGPLSFFASPSSLEALEKLSNHELGAVTAQGGITAYVDDAVVYYNMDDLSFKDIGTCDSHGVAFDEDGALQFDLEALMFMESMILVDIGSEGLQISWEENVSEEGNWWEYEGLQNNASFQLNDILIHDPASESEVALGSFSISGISSHQGELRMFPPDEVNGCGIRLFSGEKCEIDTIRYQETGNDDATTDFKLEGIMIGESILGLEIMPVEWEFDTGLFQLGVAANEPDDEDSPFTFDIGNGTDQNGDSRGFMAVNMPMKGSIRVKKMTGNSNFNMGPIAIDGIHLQKLVVEFPGRGIGN